MASTTAASSRDVDTLDALPDRQILLQDQEYLARHSLDKLFSGLMLQLLMQKPADPLQFVIDTLSLSPQEAAQDPDTGLPQHRKDKLLQVFKIIDKDGSGRISLRMLQTFASKHGGETLTLQDLQGLFADFRPSAESHINQGEFLVFFAKVSSTISNREFDEMIREMQG